MEPFNRPALVPRTLVSTRNGYGANPDRCYGRNVVVPGGYSKRFFCVPIGLYRGNLRPATARRMPARSALGGLQALTRPPSSMPRYRRFGPARPPPPARRRAPAAARPAGSARDRRQARRRRHPARARIVIAHFGGERRRYPPSGYRADWRRSGRTRPTAPRRIVARDERGARAETPVARHCRRRSRSASTLMSVPTPMRCRQFRQQRQQNCAGAGAEIGDAQRRDWQPRRRAAISSATSTTVSVSGRGTSVAGESFSGSPQNSLCAENSRDRLAREAPPREVFETLDSSAVSSGARPVIMPVRSRPSTAPTRIRASSSAEFVAGGFEAAR